MAVIVSDRWEQYKAPSPVISLEPEGTEIMSPLDRWALASCVAARAG